MVTEIINMLSPVIGEGLATSAVRMQCKKMGIDEDNLSEKNIEEFADHFAKILQVFAGDDIAMKTSQKIKELANPSMAISG